MPKCNKIVLHSHTVYKGFVLEWEKSTSKYKLKGTLVLRLDGSNPVHRVQGLTEGFAK